jgi:ParB family chromosome partitioning protein
MAKKTFAAGMTSKGVLNNDGGSKLKEVQAKAEYNFQFIDKTRIKSNPKNEKYSQDGIEALMESILVNGLRHNLSVIYDADNDVYRLVSGERRFRAICAMSDKEYRQLFPTGIPCKVEKSDVSEIDEEIMLISANHDVRETSMEVKRWEVSRLKELYEAKKINGEIKNINAEIAKQLNISERQARKYTTAEQLIPELSELLNANGIDLNQADKFGKLDEDAQRSILDIIKKNGTVETAEYQSIKALSEEREKEAKRYKSELEEANNQIKSQENTVQLLEKRIAELEKNAPEGKSKEALEDEIRFITEAKNRAEREKTKLEGSIEKMKQAQKEKEKRQTSISDTELKRISSIAKTEQALNLLENNFDILKSNKSVIRNDADLKVRVQILKDRMNDLLENL